MGWGRKGKLGGAIGGWNCSSTWQGMEGPENPTAGWVAVMWRVPRATKKAQPPPFWCSWKDILTRLKSLVGLPNGSSSKESTCQCRRFERCRFNFRVKKIPWRRKWQPTPVFLPGEFHGQRSLVGYSPRGCKGSDTTEQVLDDRKTEPSISLFFNISFIYSLVWLPLSSLQHTNFSGCCPWAFWPWRMGLLAAQYVGS